MKRPQKLDRRGMAKATVGARRGERALDLGAQLGVTHSSASSESTQSPRARSSARFFCGPGPGQSAVT